jgi:hypothetical protein
MIVFKEAGSAQFYGDKPLFSPLDIRAYAGQTERKPIFHAVYIPEEAYDNFFLKHVARMAPSSTPPFSVLARLPDYGVPRNPIVRQLVALVLMGPWAQKHGLPAGVPPPHDYYEAEIPDHVGGTDFGVGLWDVEKHLFVVPPAPRQVFRWDNIAEIAPKALPDAERKLWTEFRFKGNYIWDRIKRIDHLIVAMKSLQYKKSAA